MKDQLVECKRCGGNACYEQHIDTNTTTWLCMGCGFTTSTLMLEGSKLVHDLLETSPELYKDLLYKDSDGRMWAPSTITLPGKGMVFIDGNNKDNWTWKAVKAIEITEEDRKIKEYPKDQTHKMDMPGAKVFGQREFMDALEIIGFYDIN
jgi:hypothetical protein